MKCSFNLTFAFVTLIAIFSLYLKYDMRSQGLPYYGTGDSDHVIYAFKAYLSQTNEQLQKNDSTIPFFNYGQPTKYPLFLSYLYFKVAHFINLEGEFPVFVQMVRTIHISFYSFLLIALYFIPLKKEHKLLSIFLFSTSLILHQYFSITRIHTPTSFFFTLSVLTCFYLLQAGSRFIFLWTLLACLFSCISFSCFYTGIFGYMTLLVTLFCLFKNNQLSRNRLSCYLFLFTTLLLTFATIFYPSFIEFLQGKQTLVLTRDYPNTWFDIKSYFVYFNDLTGFDPLIGIGYLSGMFYLCKTSHLRQPQWLLFVISIIPYQLIMGILNGTDTRRTSFIIPLVIIVSAYGWNLLLKKNKKIINCTFFALSILMILSLFKYTHLATHDTRQLSHQWLKENLKPHSKIIIDSGIADCIYDPIDGPHTPLESVEVWKASQLLETFYDSSELFRNALHQMGHNKAIFHNPHALVSILKLLKYDYFVYNKSAHLDDEHFDVSSFLKKGKLLKTFSSGSSPVFPLKDSYWPNLSPYLLWRIWFQKHAGPTIEIYKLPGE